MKAVTKTTNLFDSEELNQLATDLFELDNQYAMFLQKAEKNIHSAFETRWLFGKKISENYDKIINECKTQKAFAERVKKSEATISNNKRAYENLLEEGCDTFDDVITLLKKKQIRPTISNFEKIGTLLNAPNEDTEPKEQITKDRKRLEEIMQEVSEILKRSEPANDPDIKADAEDLLQDIEDIKNYLDSFNPKKTKFKSEKYIEFIRAFGMDLITMEPCERCDPHHADPDGGTGGTADTLPDYYAIPVSRTTHSMIHMGIMNPTKEEVLEAQFRVMSAFINKVL